MRKEQLIELINNPNYKFDLAKLNSWVNALPTESLTPNTIKIGDVYMHPIFKHPYVYISKTGSKNLCALLTSNGDFEETLCNCESRFFNDSYFVKVLFTLEKPIGRFMGVYDNNKHLKEVTIALKSIICLT